MNLPEGRISSGWWFGTCFFFHFIYGIDHPSHWRTPSFFKMGTLHHQPVPSGKRLHNYGKSPCLMGKSTISMAIFNIFQDGGSTSNQSWFSSGIHILTSWALRLFFMTPKGRGSLRILRWSVRCGNDGWCSLSWCSWGSCNVQSSLTDWCFGTMEFYDFPWKKWEEYSQLTNSIIFQRGRYSTNQQEWTRQTPGLCGSPAQPFGGLPR